MDNSLTRWKRPIFKIRYSRNSQISVWKPNFFPRQAIPKIISVLHSSYTWYTPYRVQFNLDKSLTRWKRPIFKFRYSRNSQFSVWNKNFFPRQATAKILFVLHSRHPWYTPLPVWYILDNSLTRRKRPIFKITYSKLFGNNSKFPYEKLTFFLGKLQQKFFLFYSLGTHGILHTQFGSFWTTPWPDEKDLFLKLLIWNNTNFPYERLTFFLGKL